MTQSTKPLGRPTFRIDGTKLRALRVQAGLTQQGLAQNVYARAGKGHASVGVMKTSAQRWEKTGAVPANMAKHIADELKTTTAVLQGSAPDPAPSRVDELESRIKRRIADGPTPDLAAALEQCGDEGTPERELAIRLNSRLEAAQLSQAQDELERLAALTGLSAAELRSQPMSHEGYWLLMWTGPTGRETTEVVFGVAAILHSVRTGLRECVADAHESDAHVSFTTERHWFSVAFAHARLPQLTRTLRFVRCQPTESGLNWCSPTWQDEYWLKALAREAYCYANFVTDFDSACAPAECTRLRLAVTRNPVMHEPEDSTEAGRSGIIMVTEGNLSELPAATLNSFVQEGNGHDLVVNWLSADLWDKLQPLLSDWPLECWHFSKAQGRIDIHLNVPYRLDTNRDTPPASGNRFSVMLVERSDNGELRRSPWRDKSLTRILERLEQSHRDASGAEPTMASGSLPI